MHCLLQTCLPDMLDNFFIIHLVFEQLISFLHPYAEAKRERDKQNFQSISMDNVIFLVCKEINKFII